MHHDVDNHESGELPDLDSVWREYRSSLTAFLRSKVSNNADVEDLLQDILLKTHKNIAELDKGDSLKSWLFQIANNTIIDFYRKKGRNKAPHPEDLWQSDLPENIQNELEGCVLPFIKALPNDTADILRKIELEGVSQKDYAAELGISYSTLKSRVQSSRSKLRQLFENCCEFSMDAQGNVIDYASKVGSCNGC
ncbi:MAG: RNA polymerase sigma factor SigZ [Roseibium sp.]